MYPKIEIFDETLAHFGGCDGSFLTILGVKKVFWAFSKLFWSCLGSICELFSVRQGPILVVILF